MSSPQNYTLFIDESGDHHYGQMNDPASRYLCLLGAWMPDSEVTRFEIELKALKDRIFGIIPGKPVILVRSHLINKKGVFGVLNDTKICADFDSSLLALLNGLDMKLIAVLIDKKNHLSRYSSPYHPYHYCLAAMLDRYSGWLNFKNRMGIVIAEGRGRLENLQLSTAYQSVYNGGTLMFNYRHHQKALAAANIATIPKSANLAGLQLCDLLAHPAKQFVLQQQGVIAALPHHVFAHKIMAQVAHKFNRNEFSGMVGGYGIVLL